LTPKEKIISYLGRKDDFLIATHINPEGDALGSSIALSMGLASLGKKALLYERDPVPEFYSFLPGSERFQRQLPPDTESMTLVLLDCNEPARAAVENVKFGYSIVIDHHETERGFGDIKWIEPGSAATGLMVFGLLKDLGVRITKDIAVNLYSAISVDTGTFRYSNTSAEAMRASAELIEAGAEPGSIAEGIYETWSPQRLRLLARALSTLEIKDGVAYFYITGEMFKETGAKPSDTENFSNYPRMVKDVLVSALFREVDGGSFKVSLRSKGNVNVARVAEGFGGGGHRNAAGYKVDADIKTAIESLFKALEKA
jgi:phosphoesterase RecJ-like protein